MSTATVPPPTSRRRPLPPGPRGLPGIGVAPRFARDLYGYLPSLAREYGDVVHVPLPGVTMILVSHPDHVNHIMNRNMARYWKGARNAEIVNDEPLSMPVREGEDWKRVRRALNPKFNDGALSALYDVIADEIELGVERFEAHAVSGEPLDIQPELNVLVMSVLLRAMFTTRLPRADVERYVATLTDYGFAMGWRMAMHGMPGVIPRPRQRAGRAAANWFMDHLDRTIAERRAHPVASADLLSSLLDARFEDGSTLPHDEVRSELATILFAGFETTASALTWTFAQLGCSPEARAGAYAEVDALGGCRPDFEQVSALRYLRACFDEAQRLQGGPFYNRSPLEDDEIGGYLIPKDCTVVVSPYGLHRDPRFWREPERYDPGRFLHDEIDKYAFIPFNVGPRRCIGMRLAYLEAMVTLTTILQRYELRVPDGFAPEHQFHMATGIKGGVPVTVARRA
ncbi:MAG: cytochrome [Solirubrobacterales bacterium]|nr:cytochrome [Solirubrobacterales bacterium]